MREWETRDGGYKNTGHRRRQGHNDGMERKWQGLKYNKKGEKTLPPAPHRNHPLRFPPPAPPRR